MPPPLLLLQDIHLTFGGTPLLEGAEIAVAPSERLCLVGRNGSGKSTLLKIAAGLILPDSGTRFIQPGCTVRYLPQEPDLSGFATTLAYVEAGLHEGDDAHRARYLLEELGLTGEEDPVSLSGGETRRCALARVLAPRPDILLLDEPTNHLDLPAIEWLEKELGGLRSALVLISHDRRFLDTLGRSMVWLDRGVTRRLDRGFAHFEEWRDEVLAQEEAERHKLGRKIVREEDWLRYGVTARRKRNERRLAQLHALRRQRRDLRRTTGTVKLEAVAEGEVSGKLVTEAERVSKSFGARTVVRDFSIRVVRGDRVGIVGPNGAGKSTLLKLLTGELNPDSGGVRLGTNLQMAYLDQSRETLDAGVSLADALTGGGTDSVVVDGKSRHVIGLMKDFLFTPEQAKTPVGALSGGERGRLALARLVVRPSNLLVLDEPTNDLDFETLDLLQEVVGDYAGAVLVVSHDRDFLDRVATSVVASDGDGRWTEYAGGYSDMVAQRGYGVVARAPDRPAPPVASAPKVERVSVPAARRLSFKEKHALAHLPAKIDKLRAEIAAQEALLADPDLYRRDPAAWDKASAALAKATADVARAEEEWLALELRREELEG